LENRPLLTTAELCHDRRFEDRGGLVVVGSHVPKTTVQLNFLVSESSNCLPVELAVADLLESPEAVIGQAIERITTGLNHNQDVVLYTSRDLVSGQDDQDNLRISQTVSECLVNIVQRLEVRPRYLIAKGGITSSDIATRGLGVERARVAGAILPGIPVWELGSEARFPGMYYVVFPGNVGGDEALAQAVAKLG
jgi:uncharacterized protein YgbK (DUF1537 family)